jgi:hypothetical protein
MKNPDFKTFYVEAEVYGGEESFPICKCNDEKMAILVAQQLDRGGEFRGKALNGVNKRWMLRVIADDHEGFVDVIWYGKNG